MYIRRGALDRVVFCGAVAVECVYGRETGRAWKAGGWLGVGHWSVRERWGRRGGVVVRLCSVSVSVGVSVSVRW
ncbi:hypothetical protein BDU57DRAFT_518975 [Ampelomyces quisqualis]|uniref:Uncharacterized protein n=1 Tax=Ampelomyces quisqualis TaxID=50730 RepID=A0A6A5QF26_AMPQU|nr:hypothetical protein BDU57DRAFT_518975 [Ampelomyces quisqualis]